MTLKKNNYFIGGIIFIYCLIGIIPNYGAVDRVAPQWLVLSIANSIGLIYLYLNYDYYKLTIKKTFQFKPFIFLLLFVVWGLFSYIYAINHIEVIVKFFTWINIVLGVLIFCNLIFNVEKGFLVVSYVFTLILLIELYFSYDPYFQLVSLAKFNFDYSSVLKGAAANKNITAASILLKIPFLFYLISNNKNLLIKIFFSVLVAFSTFMIFLLSARASIIGLFSVTLCFIIVKLFQFTKTKNFYLLKDSFIYFILPILLSTVMFQAKYGSTNDSVSINKRITSINTQDESTKQRIRFYEHSFRQILNNPIVGVGLGNWKISSIDYDKNNIVGYTVPYHVHNDFLEIGAELGIIGLIFYLAVFIYMFYYTIKIIANESSENKELASKGSILLFGGIIFFIDSNINFPHARVLIQIPIIIYTATFFQLYFTKYKNEKL